MFDMYFDAKFATKCIKKEKKALGYQARAEFITYYF
jgi:hypothetical protein